ncbi:2-hydroxychromene-2-carboxylate isomerase [Janthinobacterium sp. 67]|nr:2-hydroxychromene-2-carboxylate isomerase [Janthinobacterium sp. 67]
MDYRHWLRRVEASGLSRVPVDNTLVFYFDFMSPFAYLAHHRLTAIAERFGYVVQYKPIDLRQAKLAAGNTGPSNREIPPKLRYLATDMNRWAAAYGVPIAFPPSFDSDRINKGLFYAVDQGQAANYVSAAWHRVWGLGGDMSDEGLLREVASELGWPADEFLASTNGTDARQRYEDNNREAQSKGVFGVPTMMVGEQMWWGNDRLNFLVEYLESTAKAATGGAK